MYDVILFSGGLDSVATALRLPDADLLYVDCGTPYSAAEHVVACGVSDLLGRRLYAVNLKGIGAYQKGDTAYIPYRNLYLALTAAAWAEQRTDASIRILMGGLRDDCVQDKTEQAFAIMTKTITALGTREVCVDSLWWEYAKTEMVKYMLESHADMFLPAAKVSVSCYQLDRAGVACGDCPSCFRKYVALADNDIECSDWFSTHPVHTKTAQGYMTKMLSDNDYDLIRRDATLRVLELHRLPASIRGALQGVS